MTSNDQQDPGDDNPELQQAIADATHQATGAWDVDTARNPATGKINIRASGVDPDIAHQEEPLPRQETNKNNNPDGFSHTEAKRAADLWIQGDKREAVRSAQAALAVDDGWNPHVPCSVRIPLPKLGVSITSHRDIDTCQLLALANNPESLQDPNTSLCAQVLHDYQQYESTGRLPERTLPSPEEGNLTRTDAYLYGVYTLLLFHDAQKNGKTSSAGLHARTALAYTRAFPPEVAKKLLAAI